ncbi:MAG: hypothetical protein KME03_12425 [Aphanocapsa lilacina HA4352-LM1]|jgi:hypothetical protein|nr:hypothetical protein [Aphanocapsa lilacina HA4352-LM1]
MTKSTEKYHQRLLELRLDIEKVQAYVLTCTSRPSGHPPAMLLTTGLHLQREMESARNN